MADHYETLGVPRDAGPDEIKRAYRQLARQLHPDANPDDPTAEARFKEVALAYEILSDPERRQQYDTFGDAGPQATLDVRVENVAAPTRNVVAILPGTDPVLKNEYVVIGAHADHVGANGVPVEHDSLKAYNMVARVEGADFDRGSQRVLPAKAGSYRDEDISDFFQRHTSITDSAANQSESFRRELRHIVLQV